MGTRADFYIGRGVDAEWIGSISHDGWPRFRDIMPVVLATSLDDFRKKVAHLFSQRGNGDHGDVYLPAQGWPWPWEDSNITDHSYAFDGDRVYVAGGFPQKVWSYFKPKPYWSILEVEPVEEEEVETHEVASFPNMAVDEEEI